MFFNFLIFFSFILIEHQIHTQEIKSYSCDTKDKIDEIKNLKTNLKRFIRHDSFIYFVLKNRIIFTKIPVYEKYKYSNVSNYGIERLFSTQFEEQEIEELDEIESIPKEYQVFGHYYDPKKNETWEYYFNDNLSNKSDNHIYSDCFLLNFNRSTNALAKRIRTETEKDLDLIEELKSEPETKYFNGIEFRNELDSKELNGEFILKYYLNKTDLTNKTGIIDIKYGYVGSPEYIKLKIKRSKLKFFTFYIVSFNDKKFYDVNHVHLIEIDDEFKIKFAIYLIGNKTELQNIGEVEFEGEELFNCHTKPTKMNETKGIYYDKKEKTFFIFIRRFYLQITEDLVKKGFTFDKQSFLNNSKDLHLDTETYLGNPFPVKSWVKTIDKNEALFTMNIADSRSNYLISTKSNSLHLNKSEKAQKFKLNQCNEQTLLIQNHLFCFEKSKYFHLYELSKVSGYDETKKPVKNKSISSIFEVNLELS